MNESGVRVKYITRNPDPCRAALLISGSSVTLLQALNDIASFLMIYFLLLQRKAVDIMLVKRLNIEHYLEVANDCSFCKLLDL